MLKVPQRTAALDRWQDGEVVRRRRRLGGPLESPGVPGIVCRDCAAVVRPEQVCKEDQDSRGLEESSDRNNKVPCVPTTARFVGVDSPRHAQKPRDMHEVEGQVEADKEKPEIQFAEGLVIHLSRHLREPVVKSSEQGKEDAADNYVVKMRNHEIRASQLPVEWRSTLHDPG